MADFRRFSSTRQVAGTTTSRTFTGDTSHNRLLGFSQTVTNASGNAATSTVTYQYNGAGDLLGDGPEVTFNLRYPGQYFDKETKLHYNYYRSYDSRTGRYTQGDPIGLDGGVESVWVCGWESAGCD